MTTINKEDFTYTANKGGYMIYYKSKPIGGAGTLSKGSNLKGKSAQNQANDYADMAKSTISDLCNNHGWGYMVEQIDEINKLSN